ncbi:MAG: hypothetical protein M3350_08225 [Actinomycetota bacterium]|nr:hypothetical protein [Actinomycetota bacterium]
MHALVFRVTIHEREEADRLLHEELVPGVSQAPGFVAGYWVNIGEKHGTSVIVFESEEAARGVVDQLPPPQTDSFTLESFDIGEVVAHAP